LNDLKQRFAGNNAVRIIEIYPPDACARQHRSDIVAESLEGLNECAKLRGGHRRRWRKLVLRIPARTGARRQSIGAGGHRGAHATILSSAALIAPDVLARTNHLRLSHGPLPLEDRSVVTLLTSSRDSAGNAVRTRAIPLRQPSRWFYASMAVAIFLAEFVGFSHSQRERSAAGLTLNPMAVLHASLFSSWIVLFLVQTLLVPTGHSRLHRRIGVAAAVLAGIMVITALPLAVDLARRGQPPGDSLAFLFLILLDVVGFAVFTAAGIYHRRRPETHKRLMLLATTSLLPPGVSRWPIAVGSPGPVVMLALAMFIAVTPLHDLWARRRVHPVSLWGGLALLVSMPLRLAVGQSAMWHRIGNWLIR
jgi:hypothetical protein